MTNKKKMKNHEDIKEIILETTKKIIKDDGLDKVSIRRITNRMGYSPGIVYHYFSDKEEIINCIFNMGYQDIIMAVGEELNRDGNAREILDNSIDAYIEAVLKNSLEYKEIMNSNNTLIREKTSLLYQGAKDSDKAIGMIVKNLNDGMSQGIYRKVDVELTSQIIWTTIFGFAFKMTQESVDDNYKKKLIKALKNNIFSSLEKK